MLNLLSLGSGSKGNAVLIYNETDSVLIDCGLGVRPIFNGLQRVGKCLSDVGALLITHEHNDHIASVSELSEGYRIPTYTHEQTFEEIAKRHYIKSAARILPLESFGVGKLEILPFRNSHDAAFPLGFSVADRDSRIVYATDLGYAGMDFLNIAQKADMVMLESNHDLDMLITGKYPRFLKERILSQKGHLSNAAAADVVGKLAKEGTKKFVLGHLSQENNLPELAFWATKTHMDELGASINADYELTLAGQFEIKEVRLK